MKENSKLNIHDELSTDSYKAVESDSSQLSTCLEIISSQNQIETMNSKAFDSNSFVSTIKNYFQHSPETLRLTDKEKLYFFDNLSMLLNAGIPILESLQIILDQSKVPKLIFLIEFIHSNIRNGKSLSQILILFAQVFDSAEIGLILAGEQTGQLAQSLDQVSESLKEKIELKNELKKASIYPVIVLCFTALVILSMLKFVIPQVSSLFVSTGLELPRVTQLLISWSEFVVGYFELIILGIILFIGGIILFFRSYIGKIILDYIFIKFSLLKTIERLKTQATFAKALGSLMANGVSIIKSLNISKESISNVYIQEYLDYVIQDVKRGVKLNEAMYLSPYFDEMFLSQIAVGENAANLPEVLKNIAKLNHKKLSDYLQNLTKLLQPAIMLFLGLVVGVVVMAIMMPLSELMNIDSTF